MLVYGKAMSLFWNRRLSLFFGFAERASAFFLESKIVGNQRFPNNFEDSAERRKKKNFEDSKRSTVEENFLSRGCKELIVKESLKSASAFSSSFGIFDSKLADERQSSIPNSMRLQIAKINIWSEQPKGLL
uniref:Uncharacterized protein n=1 Tax=Pediastrum angulosum TaxID=271408 RepID=A0A2U8GHL5_9CHLO|nr:hypothetical protein [Pediastrum angulosum]AWI68163.1 hypothetical protein [Pediastrum angulosum]